MNKEDLKGISLVITHLAYIVYRNIQSHIKKLKKKRSTYALFTRLEVEHRLHY